jgi:hypothetical protein
MFIGWLQLATKKSVGLQSERNSLYIIPSKSIAALGQAIALVVA